MRMTVLILYEKSLVHWCLLYKVDIGRSKEGLKQSDITVERKVCFSWHRWIGSIKNEI